MGRRVAKVALLTALSAVAFSIENLFPPLFVPGARLGVGNIFVMLCYIYFSLPEALIMVSVKAILAGVFGGNMFSAVYSLAAGAVSVALGFILIKISRDKISVISVASASACCHNMIQLVLFAVIGGSTGVFAYAPYLALTGVLSGVLTGTVVYLITKRDFSFLRSEKRPV